MTFRAGEPRPERAGRRKGTPNKVTQDLAAHLDALAEKYGDPFEMLLHIAADEDTQKSVRVRAAGEFLSYRHPKLRNVEVKGAGGGGFVFRIVRGDEEDGKKPDK